MVATAVGYGGGATENPTYSSVCAGDTGHAEAVLVEFDPKRVSYEKLLQLFFESHNPAWGGSRKDQYRSAVFHWSEDQRRAAEDFKDRLIGRGLVVKTEITPAPTFWKAEDYHQQYSCGIVH